MITFVFLLFSMFASPLIVNQVESGDQYSQSGSDQPGFSVSDYEAIACAPTQIAQVYTNPESSDTKDIELQPENQIRLYENFADQLCQTLSNEMQSIKFLCYDDIRKRLDDVDLWNDFNLHFTGKEYVSQDTCLMFADKLHVQGVITSSLMFGYYENPDKSRHIEVQFEGSLIDLETGRPVWQSTSRCQRDIIVQADDFEFEYACFKQVGDEFIDKFTVSDNGE